MSEKNKIKKWK